MKFKIGDKVTGNDFADATYGFTTSAAVMRIEALFENRVKVVVLSHKVSDRYVGEGDVIMVEALKLLSPLSLTNK